MKVFTVDVRGDGEFLDFVNLSLEGLLAQVPQELSERGGSNKFLGGQNRSQNRLFFFEGQVDCRGHQSGDKPLLRLIQRCIVACVNRRFNALTTRVDTAVRAASPRRLVQRESEERTAGGDRHVLLP